MKCVTTVSYSFLVNGVPKGLIKPERQIRRGYPLSPYLFILCAEVPSHLMNRFVTYRKLQGIKISNQSSAAVSHLLFSDDAFFFTLANDKSCKTRKEVLTKYEAALGQEINFWKSAITLEEK